MKAFMIHEPQKYSIVDIPIPKPSEGQVLIRSRFVGICGTDMEIVKGLLHEGIMRYPCIPGHEWSGVVEDVGSGVTSFKPGDRVVSEGVQHCGYCKFCRQAQTNLCEHRQELGFTIPGGLAEYVVVDAKMVHHLPNGFPLHLAALIEPTAVVVRGVSRVVPKPGDTIAIIGPGTIGLLSIMVANLYSPRRIILIGITDESLSLGTSIGATDVVNLTKENVLNRVKELTDGYGPEIVIESAGNSHAVNMAFSTVRSGGKVLLLGSAGKDAKVELFSDIFQQRDLEVHGVLSYNKDSWQHAVNLVTNKLIPVEKLIQHQFPFNDVEKSFHILGSGKSLGKCLIELE